MSVIDESVQSTDIDEAERLLHRVYPVARFHESRRPFSFSQQVRGDERVALVRFGITSWTEIHVDFDGTLAAGQLLAGDYRAVTNGDEVDPAAPFLLRPGAGRSESEQLDLFIVNLNEAAFARFAGSVAGVERPRLRFGGVAALTQSHATLWSESVAYVRSAFQTSEALHADLLRHAAIEMLFAAALTTFPIEVVGNAVIGRTVDGLPAAVRRALAFVDEHLDEPIGLEEMAAAARLSVRGLQSAFRRHLDTTPLAALRAARLAAAHADLVAADASEEDVATIARRWGFHHLGRFAEEHRAEYGELPRETLRR